MASGPLIGITGRTKTAGELNMKPETFRDLHLDVFYCDYARGVIAAGGLPVFLPVSADPSLYADRLDGLLLTGGTDVEPERYGQAPSPELYTREPERDAFELSLLDGALDTEKPVLGICRGIQVLNVHGGGTLHQHVPPHACHDQPPIRSSTGSIWPRARWPRRCTARRSTSTRCTTRSSTKSPTVMR